jgi:chromosome segregation ATPase
MSIEQLHSHPLTAPTVSIAPDNTPLDFIGILARLVSDNTDMALLKRQELSAKADLEIKKAELTRGQSSGAATKFPSQTEVQIKQKVNAENLCQSLSAKVKEKGLNVEETSNLLMVKLSSVLEGSGRTTTGQEVIETLRKDNEALGKRCQELESFTKKQETAQKEITSTITAIQARLEERVSSMGERTAKVEKSIIDQNRVTSDRKGDDQRRERQIEAKFHNLDRWRENTDADIKRLIKHKSESDKALNDVRQDVRRLSEDSSESSKALESLGKDILAIKKTATTSTSLPPHVQDKLGKLEKFSERLDNTSQSLKASENKVNTVIGHVNKLVDAQAKASSETSKETSAWKIWKSEHDNRLDAVESNATAMNASIACLKDSLLVSKKDVLETRDSAMAASEVQKSGKTQSFAAVHDRLASAETQLATISILENRIASMENEKVPTESAVDANESAELNRRVSTVEKSNKLYARRIDVEKLDKRIEAELKRPTIASAVERDQPISSSRSKESRQLDSKVSSRLTALEERISKSSFDKDDTDTSVTIAQLQAQLETLKSTSRSQGADISGISARLQRVEGLPNPEVSNTADILSRLGDLEGDLQTGLASTEDTLGALMDGIKADAKSLKFSVEAQADQISSANARKADLDSRLSAVQERVRLIEDVQSSTANALQTSKSMDDLQVSDTAVKTQINEVETRLAAYFHTIFATKMEVKEGNLHCLEPRLQQFDTRIQRLADYCEANGLALADLDARYININTTDLHKAMANQFCAEVFPQLAQLRDTVGQVKANAESSEKKLEDLEKAAQDLSSQISILKREFQDEQAVRKEGSSEFSKMKTEVELTKRDMADIFAELKDDINAQHTFNNNSSSDQGPRRAGPLSLNGKRKFDTLRGEGSPRSSLSMSPRLGSGQFTKGNPGPSVLRTKKARTDQDSPLEHENSFFELRARPISDEED